MVTGKLYHVDSLSKKELRNLVWQMDASLTSAYLRERDIHKKFQALRGGVVSGLEAADELIEKKELR